jgi:hypothetical protein
MASLASSGPKRLVMPRHRQLEQAAAQQRQPGLGAAGKAAAQDEAAQPRWWRGRDRDGQRARERFAEQHEGLVGGELRAHQPLELVVAHGFGAGIAHHVDGAVPSRGLHGLRQGLEQVARAVHARKQDKAQGVGGMNGRRRHFQAARKASMTLAELSAAMPMKVPISFSPSPPPARSLSERKAMYGTPLL